MPIRPKHSPRVPASAPKRAVAAGRPKPGRRKSVPANSRRDEPYHHGDLRQALLDAAEVVLERDGLAGLTLRAAAREAVVSHAAPSHHFGDLTGLVSELAAIGFRRFNEAMRQAGAIDGTPIEKAMARARGYVAYARAKPGMYGLMFRTERLDMTRPALREAADASFAGLAGSIGATRHETIDDEALTLDQAAQIVKAWSMVHGFTMLMLDGRLRDIFNRLDHAVDAETLLVAMLKATTLAP